jgi:hypothetical protein
MGQGQRDGAERQLELPAVNDPVWDDEQRLPTGWRTTFAIKLEGTRGASPEVAMRALGKVAEMLHGGKAAQQ